MLSDNTPILGALIGRVRGTRRSRAAELCEASGTTCPRGGRRGSALILVLGALALISIFAAIYVTIGQSDRRTSSALEVNRRVSEFPLIISDYVVDVIGADRLAVEVRPGISAEGNGGPAGGGWGVGGGGGGLGNNLGDPKAVLSLHRENTDFPYTDYAVRSLPSLISTTVPPKELLKFNPVGTHYDVQTGLGLWAASGSDVGAQFESFALDRRVASDPWLASTEATYLGSPDFADRMYSAAAANNNERQSQMLYLDRRDWAHITNISPDGLYVNLWNIRPEAGGYGAEPGYSRNGNVTTGQERMSDNLSLIEPSGDADAPLRGMHVRSDGFWVPGAAGPTPWDTSANGDPENVPALWSSNQRFMFLPLNQTFIFQDGPNPHGYAGVNPGDISTWASPYYPAYQYADADGDGMADSRWFEMMDSSGTANLNDWIFRNLAAVDGYRLFAAVRVVDLSALVNVNTATDGLVPPTAKAWAGQTPADIDLRRILTMLDPSTNYLDWKAPTSKNLSYTSIKRDGRPAWAGGQDSDVYTDYSNYFSNLTVGQFDDTGLRIGRSASDALRLAVIGEGTLGELVSGGDGRNSSLVPGSSFYDSRPPNGAEDLGMTGDDKASLRRLFYYDRVGSRDQTDPMSAGVQDLGAGWFGMTDLGELLTFWGINDDQTFTRLEQTAGNRYDNGEGVNVAAATLRLSPLMSDRPTELDRQRHDTLFKDIDRNAGPGPTGQVDPDSMALFATSVRRRLTTFNGYTPLLDSPLSTADVLSLSTREVPDLAHKYLEGVRTGNVSKTSVYATYLDALAKGLQIEDAWELNGDQVQLNEYSTLFYGAAGPEVAARLAAHLTVNLADAYDEDSIPTVMSFLVTDDSALEATFDDLINNPQPGNSVSSISFPWGPQNLVTLNDFNGQKYSGADDSATSEAYTVYGVEAYPVLTEVASMIVLTDAPLGAGGDNDASGGGRPGGFIGGPSDDPEITIAVDDWDGDGGSYGPNDAWAQNPDLAYIGIAFQLTNPFDEVISLGSDTKGDGDTLTDREYLYYIEYNGRYFKLGEYDQMSGDYLNVSLDPGESKTFYVMANPSFQDIATKWTDLVDGYSPGTVVMADDVEDWINAQYRVLQGGNTTNPSRVIKFNPVSGRSNVPAGFDSPLTPGLMSQALLNRPASESTVRLWRRMEVQGNPVANYLPQHDLLVDRISEAAGGLVGNTLSPIPRSLTQDEVKGTVAGNETTANSGNIAGRNDNSGWTYVFYGTMRRGDHPGTATSHHGVLPGWMIDAGTGTNVYQTTPFANSLLPSGEEPNPRSLKDDHFFAGFSRRYAHESFSDLLGLRDPARPIVATIGRHPYEKNNLDPSVAGLFTGKTVSPLDGDTFYEPAMTPGTVAMYPELGPNDRDVDDDVSVDYPFGQSHTLNNTPLVRATDLLMIPALGWVETPDPSNPLVFADEQWVTFGEALSYAMHLRALNTGDPVLRHLVRTVNTTSRRYALDGLNLRVDDFVPFYNADNDADRLYDPSAGDARIGAGVPMAVELVSRFRGLGPTSADDALTTKIMGALNLNTAALDPMRALPLVTPSLEETPEAGGSTMYAEWWGSNPAMGGFQMGLPDAVADAALFRAPDVAAHLASYRDRLAGEYRLWSYDYNTMPASLAGGNDPFGYRPFSSTTGMLRVNPADIAQSVTRNYKGVPTGDFELGRTLVTGIEGLRESPGFSSTAEAAAAIVNPDMLATPTDIDLLRQNLPNYLGTDEDSGGAARNMGVRTVGNEVVTLETQLYGSSNDQGDDVPNDYEERLAVLSGLLNTTSTRSDTYAVWFLVHGYRESDVKNLRADDPLTPSYARRFVMVIDRSNVTTQGEKPRVLLFREVPL